MPESFQLSGLEITNDVTVSNVSQIIHDHDTQVFTDKADGTVGQQTLQATGVRT